MVVVIAQSVPAENTARVDLDAGLALEHLIRTRADRLADQDRGVVADPERLVTVRRLPARSARYGSLQVPLPPEIASHLPGRLWSHQATAIDLVRAGTSVVVATGTGSGKSLVHQVAIAEIARRPVRPGTALCIYPTKALGRDQLRSLDERGFDKVLAHAYDGDTGSAERADARRTANVIVTNPEMLHYGILPHHQRWESFLSRLSVVVIDELHVFRGIFGSHVGNVVRRLRRVAAHYGADPVFVMSSATIGEPAALAERILGSAAVAVTDDGSPVGERVVTVWNAPLLDPDTGRRGSGQGEVAGLLAELTRAGSRSIGFAPSRREVEVVAERVRRSVPSSARDGVRAYRAGLLTEERHEIEDGLRSGRITTVVATSALELGVDLPGLDACVLDGFPGTMSSLWQRIGRVGRDQRASLAVLVCGSDQLDQWVARHPDELFERAPEPAVVNPDNPFVVDPHLRCAAFELPLTHADRRWWPVSLDEAVCRLASTGDLVVRPPGDAVRWKRGRRRRPAAVRSPLAVWTGGGWPVDAVGLRSTSPGAVEIVRDDGSRVGTTDRARAPEQVHQGAVYLHAGIRYRVVSLDLDAGRAVVEPDPTGTTTVPRTRTDLRIIGTQRERHAGPVLLGTGPVEVTTQVTGYERRDLRSGDLVERVSLDLPPAVLQTTAMWRVVPEEVLRDAGLARGRWPGVLHAVEHAAIGLLPRFAICDRWDVGGVSTVRHRDTGLPTIVIYDGHPGGAGIAALAFDVVEVHDRTVARLLEECGCRDGCPSCVQSPKCGNGNEPLDKAGARRLMEHLVDDVVDLDAVVRGVWPAGSDRGSDRPSPT